MKKSIIFWLILLTISSNLWCQYEKLIADTATKYKSAKTFEADVIQSVAISYADIQMDSVGKMFLSEGVFALEYTSPKYQFITYADGVVTLYMQEENSAVITNIPENAKNDLFNPADVINTDRAEYTFVREENDMVVFKVLDPDTPQADVKLFISKKDNSLVKIESDLGSGEFTTISLRNQRFNLPLSKQPNSFQVPDGVTIIRY